MTIEACNLGAQPIDVGRSSVDTLTPPRTSTEIEVLLTAEQLVAQLNVPMSRIEQATARGRLPQRRFGYYFRYGVGAVIAA